MAAEERKPLHLEGTVEHVMYCNAENGYTVLELDAGGTLITVVGEMGETEEGEQLSVDGEYTTHPRYGMQFRAQYWERKLPAEHPALSLLRRHQGHRTVSGKENRGKLRRSHPGDHGKRADPSPGDTGNLSEKM